MNASRLYESLSQMLNDGVVLHEFTTDRSRARFLAANDAACRLLGYTAEEMSRLSPFDIVAPGEAPHAPPHEGEARWDVSLVHEKRLLAKDGRLVPVEISSRIFEDQGRTLAVCALRDVTERKRAEEARGESERRLRLHIQSTPVAVIEYDVQFRITAWNPAAEAIFGWSAREAMGRSASFIVAESARLHVSRIFQQLLDRKSGQRSVNENVTKDGRIIVCDWNNSTLVSPSGEVMGIASMALDITEQRRLEEQLHQAQKLESVGRLAGGIAHDFNNLLTVILSCAETLKADVAAGSPAQPEVIDDIHAAGKRAAELTQQLLAFARKQVIAPIPIDLNDVVRGSEKMLRRVLGEDVEIVVALQPGAWTVRCDPGQMERVVLNLAVNARDAMPGGGTLTVETANVEVDARLTAAHPWVRPGPHVRLTLRDVGHGMSPEVKEHVFEPFFSTRPVGRGTGLGLATVYGIVKQSGGYVLVDSAVGEGTTFEIYLPRALDGP